MKTTTALFVSLLVAGNVAFAQDSSAAAERNVDTFSPTTTSQADLHNVRANYLSVQRAATGQVAQSANVQASSEQTATERFIDTGAPTTTNQADLHNVQANYQTIQRVYVTPAESAVQGYVAPRIVNTGAPTTTNQADLHNLAANYATIERAQQQRAEKRARQIAKN